MKLWRVKWENIIFISLLITMTLCWIAFVIVSNVYTLAIATIISLMTTLIYVSSDTIRDFRHYVIKNWK